MWRDEAQRRVHQSTMETGNVSRVQRMHSAEARSRHALSMHTVRPVARRSTLSVKASQPAVEHVSRLPFMRHQKKCFVCNKNQTKEFFCTAAWHTRKPERRLCLCCQTKTRGSWKCATCRQRKPQQQFSSFISRRPSGKDGTQTCNTCRAAMVQDTIRKRAATSAAARLEPLRKRLRRARVLRETWEAIAERRNSDGQSRVKHFQASSATDASKSDCVAQAPPASRQKSPEYVYTCPFCNGEVTSSIASGHIDHRHVCGKQFRVENGSLRPTMRYAHTCPTCGTCVHSSKEAGRIQSKHKQPNGRACPQTEWQTS